MGPRVSRLNLHNGVVNYHSENCSRAARAVFGSCVGTTLLISSCLGLSFVLPEPAKVMVWSHVFIYLLVCMYVCYQLFSKTTGLNCMKFSGMICHHPRTNRLDFGSDQVKGQGHDKVKNVFLS